MAQRAITIGVFDGVHLGHRALVAAARAAVGDGHVTALSFEPHPMRVLRPEQAPAQLSSFAQRARWLAEAGADEVVALEPTRELLHMEPRAFLEHLMQEYRPDVIVEGRDFRFGHDRAGSVETLTECRTLGYRPVIVDDVVATLSDRSSVRVTSTLVRWLLARGRVRDAALLLGRPYEITGTVVTGDQRGGRQLGVATANLDHRPYLLPADGIYCGHARRDGGGQVYPAAVSIGTKPTFGSHPRVLEAHLIGYEGPDDYGWTLHLALGDWLRDQIAFSTVDLLIRQIEGDIEAVRKWSASGGPWTGMRSDGQKLASGTSAATIRTG